MATFLDSDGDGVGDRAGLTRRLDHLAQLGVTTVWLMPFYPSPGPGIELAGYGYRWLRLSEESSPL